MARFTATIICRDEEAKIEACLRSVSWCDEIVVVDSGSTDRTVEIARKYTEKVLHHPWIGYVAQQRFALEQATGEWVICLDADERCTPALEEALAREIPRAGEAVGFEVRRRVEYLGRWIRHGGWYPDWKLRVVRRGRATWEGRDPHYRLIPDGPIRRLKADLLHETYRDFREQLRTVDRFSDVVAEEWARAGRRFRFSRAILHPFVKFLEGYIWKRGVLDGWPGFVIAVTSAFYVFAKHVKLGEKGGVRK